MSRVFFGEASSSRWPPAAGGRQDVARAECGLEFKIQRTDLALPALTFWQPRHWPRPRGAPRSGSVGPAGTVSFGYTVEFSQTGPAGVEPARPLRRHVDARRWRHPADPCHGAKLDGRTGHEVRHERTGPAVRTALGAGAPIARRGLFVRGATGPVRPGFLPMTDGRFWGQFPSSRVRPVHRDARAHTVGVSRTPRSGLTSDSHGRSVRSFAHGWPTAGLTVDTSGDGVHWTTRKTVETVDPFEKDSLPGPVTARFVRLSTLRKSDQITSLTELSVWPAV